MSDYMGLCTICEKIKTTNKEDGVFVCGSCGNDRFFKRGGRLVFQKPTAVNINHSNLMAALTEATTAQEKREENSLMKSSYLTNISEALEAMKRSEEIGIKY